MDLIDKCSVHNCKKAATCMCHHCETNVCAKHFNEHQALVNSELLPLTDRLNQLKMRLKTAASQNKTLTMLDQWRDKKHREIDQEYKKNVQVFERKISEQEEKVSGTVANVEELIREGDASSKQVNELKKKIEFLEKSIDHFMTNDSMEISSTKNEYSDLVNCTFVLGKLKYLVKGVFLCGDIKLCALECETSLIGYDGICPQCANTHVSLGEGRGLYVCYDTILQKVTDNCDNKR